MSKTVSVLKKSPKSETPSEEATSHLLKVPENESPPTSSAELSNSTTPSLFQIPQLEPNGVEGQESSNATINQHHLLPQEHDSAKKEDYNNAKQVTPTSV